METLDLHPEELLDRANQGLASEDELARIDAHLASCATCRFERRVRMDFDAVAGSTADLDELVARALSGAQKVPEAPRRRRVGPLLIAATIALMGFGSFAAVVQFTGVLPRLIEQLTTAHSPVPLSPAGERGRVVVPQPLPEVVPEVIPEDVPPPAPPPAIVRVRPHTPTHTPRGEREKVVPEIPAEPDALAVFSRATQERVRGDSVAAINDFRFIVARFPSSPEAALSHAALGRLLLDRGEAASALESFDAYLSSGDQGLREDVQGSRAMALHSLGRVDDERTAWEAVLHDYPSGVFAPRARARLESLVP